MADNQEHEVSFFKNPEQGAYDYFRRTRAGVGVIVVSELATNHVATEALSTPQPEVSSEAPTPYAQVRFD